MLIRHFRESDALSRIHGAQNFPYPFPNLATLLFLTKMVVAEEGQGSSREEKIHGAALLRLTAEAYLLLDPLAETPRQRWQWLLALHAAAEPEAWQLGLEDVHAWLPPSIADKFGRRLKRLGWVRDDAWTPFCKKLEIRD